MGLFGRMKRAIKSKANAAVEKAVSPERELEMAILELEAQHKQALRELLAYKATAKVLERDIAAAEEKAATWERRAMAAVRKGDDALARECLREQKAAAADLERMKRDRGEAAGFAAELNRSRKQVETRLQMLRLKKGTMATQIAAARSGTGSAFGFDDKAMERMDRAEQRIESDAIAAEVESGMAVDGVGAPSSGVSEAAFDAALAAAGADPSAAGDDALTQLKAKMEADREAKQKLLKKGT
jgi:phage shock protein A